MTNEEAVARIREHMIIHKNKEPRAIYITEALEMAIKALEQEEAREHMDMLIAHKDKALKTHPYFERCNCCIHSEEQDGSSCYECVKGMADNFEAQPKTGYISIDVNKLAKEVAEKVLDEITYEEKTIREWVEILVKQQPSERRGEAYKLCECSYRRI